MIRGAVLLGALALGAFTGAGPKATPVPTCPAGELIVRGDEPLGCDAVGNMNTITVLDITPTQCDDQGGTWRADGACDDVDF